MRRFLQSFSRCLVLIVILFQYHNQQNVPIFPRGLSGTNEIQKPDNDHREYKLVTLNNTLRALLISDPNTDMSAASLNVYVGYDSDPKDVQGLAHFLEHMLFLGTKKYPDETDFAEYFSRNAGMRNAYTSGLQTNYFFEVNSQFLQGALDRFAQFFIAPLFNESGTQREMSAVDSEFKLNAPDNGFRLNLIHKSFTPPGHPYFQFGVGNLETLRTVPESKGIRVRDELLKFHEKYYSANIMQLVILGKEKLDTLAEWAQSLFEPIQNKNVEAPSTLIKTHPWDSLSPDQINQFYRFKSLVDVKQLDITWKVRGSPDWWAKKPSKYILHLLNHQGKGSLLSYLKAKGWAIKVSATLQSEGVNFDFLTVKIDLTEEGMPHIEEIVVAVFEFLSLIKTSGPQKRIFDEMKKLSEINFKFNEIDSVSKYVRGLSTAMQEPFPPRNLLNGPTVLLEWDPSLIQTYLQSLDTIFQITLSATNHPNVNLDKKEHYTQAEYRMDPTSPDLIAKLKIVKPNPNFSLPQPNSFIPGNINVEKHSMRQSAPDIVHQNKHMRLWYLRDHTYWIPQASLKVSFKSPLISKSAANSALSDLLVLYIEDSMTEFIYDAKLANLQFSVLADAASITLSMYGISEKFDLILQEFAKTMVQLPSINSGFSQSKSALLNKYANWEFEDPVNKSIFFVQRASQRPMYSQIEQAQALKDCTQEVFIQFVKELRSSFFIESLYVGNVVAGKYIKWLQSSLDADFSKGTPLPLTLQPVLLPATNTIYRLKGTDPINSAVVYYLQVCHSGDFQALALLGLLVQLTKGPAFQRLRTELQLGYIVDADTFTHMNTAGYIVVVQSEKPVKEVESHIRQFLESIETYLKDLPLSDYNSYVNGFVAKMVEKKKNLGELAMSHWQQITSERYTFDVAQKIAEIAKSLKLEEARAFFMKHIHPSSKDARKFSVHYLSSKSTAEDIPNATIIDNLPNWVSQQKNYEVPAASLPDFINISSARNSTTFGCLISVFFLLFYSLFM